MEQKIRENPEMISLSSHFIRHFPADLAGRRLLYFSFVREPMDWYISYFSYIKKKYDSFPEVLRKKLPPNCSNLSIRESIAFTLKKEGSQGTVGNWLTRFFCTTACEESGNRVPKDNDFEDKCLQFSKRALDSFAFVGLTERFNESFQALRTFIRSYGFDLCALDAPFENISSDFRGDLSWLHPKDPFGAVVFQSMEVDFRLYAYARELALCHLAKNQAS